MVDLDDEDIVNYEYRIRIFLKNPNIWDEHPVLFVDDKGDSKWYKEKYQQAVNLADRIQYNEYTALYAEISRYEKNKIITTIIPKQDSLFRLRNKNKTPIQKKVGIGETKNLMRARNYFPKFSRG